MDFLPNWNLMHIKDVQINDGNDYNRLLTDPTFWNNLKYDKVLIFQHDSMILREGVEEFLDYSYVGAPWKSDAPWAMPDRRGGNGGISVRDVRAHQRLLSHQRWSHNQGNEDVFFSKNLTHVAPYEVCAKFGVETEFKLGTFSYHAIDKHLTPDECNQIMTQYDT